MEHTHRKTEQSGPGAFTLVELLVVVAVIAILASLLLPVLSRAKARALVVACMNHERQMGLALRMYMDDHHAYPFYFVTYANSDGLGFDRWQQSLNPYYPLDWLNPAYHCPAYKGVISSNFFAGAEWSEEWFGSYGYNVAGTDWVQVGDPLWHPSLGLSGNKADGLNLLPNAHPPVGEAQVAVPSEMYALMDARSGGMGGLGSPTPAWVGVDFTFGASSWHSALSLAHPPQHGANFNVEFCDGHVAPVKLTDLFNPTNTARFWNNDHQPHPELW